MLAPTVLPAAQDSNFADPSSLGVHNTSSEVSGIVYTGLYGFLDLAHIRDMCDLTKWAYDEISARGGLAPFTLKLDEGEATIHTSLPPNEWISVARAIAYDDGLAHEILSYDEHAPPGGHNSSFSPEDLCSNYFGTRVAEVAILAGGDFKTNVTKALKSMLFSAVSKADCMRAFDTINDCWVKFTGWTSFQNDDHLRRRNFSVWPWKAGIFSMNSPTPSWIGAGFGRAETLYTYAAVQRSLLGGVIKTIPKSSFPAEITRIRTDAQRRYGQDFDKSRPCPRIPSP
jgi:hypothetical protein